MNEIIRLGLALMAVMLIAAGALALTNYYTAPQIELQKELAIKQSLNKVIQADSFEEENGYYEAYQDGILVGKVLKIEAPGYSSLINALVGINTENRITGIDVVSQQETPGLGANIEKESFLGQFIGKTGEMVKIRKDGGEIDGVTGATISSRAITDEVRKMIEECPCDGITGASPEWNITEEEINETEFEEAINDEMTELEEELNDSEIDEISIIGLEIMVENETTE